MSAQAPLTGAREAGLALMLGERFGGFKAVARLGAGTMGEVYLAEHQRINRRVAIKVLLPRWSRNAQAVQRLFIEARAMSLIRHPGIIDVYDFDVHRNGRAYIVMEYLAGQTLGRRLSAAGALPWPQACGIARRIAHAMAAAHERSIIHRDLKPENVFLTSASDRPGPGEVKVLDFGFAKVFASNLDAGEPAPAETFLGSPVYMSPEQCEAAPTDHRSDVYALGCVLFEMVSGLPPFPYEDVGRLLAAHRSRTPPVLCDWAAGAPGWLGNLVARMLSKSPAERPQSMDEVAESLRVQAPGNVDVRRGGRMVYARV